MKNLNKICLLYKLRINEKYKQKPSSAWKNMGNDMLYKKRQLDAEKSNWNELNKIVCKKISRIFSK